MSKRNFVSAKGARLLRRVAKHILAEPLRYNQNEIIARGEPWSRYGDRTYPACGTVACIGGWIQVLTLKRAPRIFELRYKRIAKLLDVSTESIAKLCDYVYHSEYGAWPERFNAAYLRAKTPLEKAQVANRRIEHFIKTGE